MNSNKQTSETCEQCQYIETEPGYIWCHNKKRRKEIIPDTKYPGMATPIDGVRCSHFAELEKL